MTALVTGSAGGIGSAIVTKLRKEGFEVRELDLVNGFDVTDPEAWEHVGSVDLACLNAGVLTGSEDVAQLTDEQYRRAVGVNVDGVVFGVRRLDRVMPTGSTIIATASLAGLTAIPDDPIYGLTKHAVVGFVRSVAPQLSKRGIRIQAVCPGWADTGLMSNGFKEELGSRGFRLLQPLRGGARACGPRSQGARERARRWIDPARPARPACSTSSRACRGRVSRSASRRRRRTTSGSGARRPCGAPRPGRRRCGRRARARASSRAASRRSARARRAPAPRGRSPR